MTQQQSGHGEDCPCGSGRRLIDCCDHALDRGRQPATAEALMRSRYTAFVLGDERYLLETWHPDTRPGKLDLSGDRRWLGLKILATSGGGPEDTLGTVEFVARYKIAGRGYRLHEHSRFERTDGGWRYVDGERGATDSSRRG